MKRAAGEGPAGPKPETAPAAAPATPGAPDADARPDSEILQELGLPEPESLKPGDDFSGFMAKAVPERLRNRALRRLWLTDPVMANVDGLVEYGGDFTDAAMVIENLQTVYKVGRGMLDRLTDDAERTEPGNAEVPVADADPAVPEAILPAGAETAEAGSDEAASVEESRPEPRIWPDAPVGAQGASRETHHARQRIRFRVVED